MATPSRPSTPRTARRPSARRKTLYAALATFAFFALSEIGIRSLRLAPLQEAPSPLPFQQITMPPVAAGPIPGTRVFQTPGCLPETRRATLTSDVARGVRILTYGGSATFGRDFPPHATFSGWLQRGLNAVTDEPVEVINMGVCGWDSTLVKQHIDLTLQQESPDLVVVYSGNNEFIDRRALRMLLPYYVPQSDYLKRPLARSHLYRWLRQIVTRSGPRSAPAPATVPIDIALTAPVTQGDRDVAAWVYRRNLDAIATLARQRDVPLLLATVADNQRDWCAECAQPDVGLGAAAQAALEDLERVAETGSDAELKARAADLDAVLGSEAAQHRLAHLLLARGLAEEARECFEQAEYLTTAPQRSNHQLRDVVRDVARSEDVTLCDTAAALAALSPDRVLGFDVFFDDCHPNALGHRRLGRLLTECALDGPLDHLAGAPHRIPQQLDTVFANDDDGIAPPWRLDRWDTRVTGGHVPDPGPGAVSLTLAGHTAYVVHRYDHARVFYERALEAGAPPGPLHVNLGLTAIGRLDASEAKQAFDAALQAMPEDDDTKNYRSLLGP